MSVLYKDVDAVASVDFGLILSLCHSPPRRNDLLSKGFDVSRMEWVRQLSENISPRFHSI